MSTKAKAVKAKEVNGKKFKVSEKGSVVGVHSMAGCLAHHMGEMPFDGTKASAKNRKERIAWLTADLAALDVGDTHTPYLSRSCFERTE